VGVEVPVAVQKRGCGGVLYELIQKKVFGGDKGIAKAV